MQTTEPTENLEVVQLFNSLTVLSLGEITVQSSTPFELSVGCEWPIIVSSRSPITLTSLPRTATRSVPRLHFAAKDNLDSRFAEGWKKLPDELKVRILRYNLTVDEPIHYCRTTGGWPWGQVLLPHYLLMPLEIAGIAHEVFYKTNTFFLKPGRSNASFRYPNLPNNQYVRRLVFQVKPERPHWKYVPKLASGEYGFANLDYVQIQLDWTAPRENPLLSLLYLARQKAVFKCDGDLEFVYWHEPGMRVYDSDTEKLLEDAEFRVRDIVAFNMK